MSEADFSQQEPQTSPESTLDSSEGTVSSQPDHSAIESTPITSPDAKPIERFEQRITDETAIALDSSPADLTKGRPRLREADWFSLARKLRQRNRDLLQKVALLEEDLAKTQEALETETSRSRSLDSLNTQQSKEISLNQEKIRNLYAELEVSHQATQRQNSINTDLSAQLQVAQHRLEELEREYTNLHHHYQQQTQQLQDIQTQSQELSVRLQRQQRQTLQFKSALDKCLAAKSTLQATMTSEATVTPTAPKPQPSPPTLPSSAPIAIKAQPIQPWSSRSDEPLDWVSLTDFSNVTADIPEAPTPELSELEQNWREFSEEGAEIVVSAFDDLLEGTSSEISAPKSDLKPPTPPEAVLNPQPDTAETSPISISPSPIVYPQRPTKKRKSLAAIELPSFPRYEPS
ncbi:MAG: hypothetical protein ACLFV6_02380 [Spirulinaceae cyanobacterium]